MSSRTSLNVSLTVELEKFVHDRVASGRYQTASEVVREGLRLLERREHDNDKAHQALKLKLRRGAEQAGRGELVDGEEFFEKLINRVKKPKQRGFA